MDDAAFGRLIDGRDQRVNFRRARLPTSARAFVEAAQSRAHAAIVH